MTQSRKLSSSWKGIYKLGGAAALTAVLVGILEILITFLPGGNTPHESAVDWLLFYRQNWFMGLRDLGLLNMVLDLSAALIFFALYAAHREGPYQPYAALITILSFLGIGVFFATNRAFPMLSLSHQYAAATDAAERIALEAAARAMLSVGQSHTAGTFPAFLFMELAGALMSILTLKSGAVGRAAAWAGLIGFGMLLIFEFIASFFTGLTAVAMGLAMLGGLSSLAWYILIARRLFELGREPLSPA